MAPLVQKGTQVDPQRDLAPVGLALRAVGLFAANPKAPFKTLRELVAYAKANPTKVFYGSAGIGATNHVAIEQFKALAGIDMTHVPYKGSGPLITALMAGEVTLALLDFSSAQPGLARSAIVPVVQTASRRLSSMPDVPTLAETGFRDYDPSFWIGLAVPRATPPAIVARLNKALNVALADTQMKARAQVNGWEIVGGAPDVLGSTIANDMAQYPALVRRLDIKAS
jgi:tripartite-type tricarboxylate transporter receptor subunit TctC